MAASMLESSTTNSPTGSVTLSTLTKTNTSGNSFRAKSTERATTFSVRERFLVESGKMIKKSKANSLFSMETFSKAALETINATKANTGTETEIFIKGLGRTISKRDTANFTLKTDKNTRENSQRAKSTAKASTRGEMGTDMKGTSLMINAKVWENTTGTMEDFIKASGRLIE